jgi:hypothetical protein
MLDLEMRQRNKLVEKQTGFKVKEEKIKEEPTT